MRLSRAGSVNERLMSRYKVDSSSGCWVWFGAADKKGYGRISGEIVGYGHVRSMLTHRASWIIHRGPIPSHDSVHGTVVMHICDNPACLNPDHLRLGTQSDNVLDMVAKGRRTTYRPQKGIANPKAAIKDQASIDLICSTAGRTNELAEKFGVTVSTIMRIRSRNGASVTGAERFRNKEIPQEALDHIRSSKPGTRGLGKLYGLGSTTIRNIRLGITRAR